MSRSGYTDDFDYDEDSMLANGRWRGQVRSAIRGKRGQKLLRDLAAALDAMPVKELIADSLQDADGDFCTLGVLGAARGIDLSKLDPEDPEQVGAAFDIARQMAAEIVFENDEGFVGTKWVEVPRMGPFRPYDCRYDSHEVEVEGARAKRWKHMRAWVEQHLIKKEASNG